MNWTGVLPAVTTNLRPNGAIESAAFARHCRRMIASDCRGIVCAGSLGEAATRSRIARGSSIIQPPAGNRLARK